MDAAERARDAFRAEAEDLDRLLEEMRKASATEEDE
jgi:hypothetical protein